MARRKQLMFCGVLIMSLVAIWALPVLAQTATSYYPMYPVNPTQSPQPKPTVNQPPTRPVSLADYRVALAKGRVVKVIAEEIIGGGAKWRWLEKGSKAEKEVLVTAETKERWLKELESRPAIQTQVIPQRMQTDFTGLIFTIGAIVFLVLMIRRLGTPGQQGGEFTKSGAKQLSSGTVPDVHFSDVAGIDEAVEELQEVVDFLRRPMKFRAMNAEIPRGVLLVGPPGCGKTLLAKAIAGEAGVPFFTISGSQFVEVFVGVGASRVRDLFNTAKKHAPCLIFVDEIDAVGRHRGAGIGSGHDEREQTLNQLLVEMDGFDPNAGLIVIAATNRPDILDPALLRSGRFDRRVTVDWPDSHGRAQIIKVHSRGKPLETDVTPEILARLTPGFSGADLKNLVNEAAILAVRRKKDKVGMPEFREAIERIIAGPEKKNRRRIVKDLEKTAVHEAGHTLAAYLLPAADKPHKVTINPRGKALGYMMPLPEEDKFSYSKEELIANIKVAMAGRAAEALLFWHWKPEGERPKNEEDVYTTGAVNDIRQCTEIARKIVVEFGMSRELGPIYLANPEEEVFLGRDLISTGNFSDQTKRQVDIIIKNITSRCYEKVRELLAEHREELERLAKTLFERRSLEGDEIGLAIKGELKDQS